MMIILYHQIKILIDFLCRQIETLKILFTDKKNKKLPVKLNEAIGIKFVYDEVIKNLILDLSFKNR